MTRKTVKRAAVLLLLIAMTVSLPGCWDGSEIDELGYVLAIGIDRGNPGYSYTFWLAVPRKLVSGAGGGSGGGGGGDGGGKVHVLTVDAPDLTSAMNLTNTWIARQLTLEHAKALVIGEALARENILSALAPAVRFREFRRNMLIMVSRTTAREFLEKNQPSIEENPARWIELMGKRQDLTGFTTASTIHDFFLDSESQSALPLVILGGVNTASQGGGQAATGPNRLPPAAVDGAYLPGTIPRSGGDPVELIGGAVFNGDKMVGTLTGDEVRFALMLRGDFQRMYYAEPDPFGPGYFIGIDVRQSRKPKIEITYDGTRPRIDVTVSLEGDIVGIESLHDYTVPAETLVLERAIEQDFTLQLQAVIARSQKEFGGDLFDFGDHARAHFWTWQDWADYRWQERFVEAAVTPHVKFSFRRFGLQFAPPMPPVDRPQPPQQKPGAGGGEGGSAGDSTGGSTGAGGQ
ncbi:MAG: Ger(x)C family spore germination protein [Symbiobacteriia bacterium]